MRFERRLPSLFAAAALLLPAGLAAQPAPRTPTPAAVEDDKRRQGQESPATRSLRRRRSRSSRTTRSGSAARRSDTRRPRATCR